MTQNPESLKPGERDFAVLVCWERHGRELVGPCQDCLEQAHLLYALVLDVACAAGRAIAHAGDRAHGADAIRIWSTTAVVRELAQRRIDGDDAAGYLLGPPAKP